MESATCVLHGKSRTLNNLEHIDNGDWVCIKSSRCKSSNKRSIGLSSNQSYWVSGYGGFYGPHHGGWMTMNNGAGRGFFCSVHGKKRTMQNLIKNNMGNWICAPG